MHLHSLTFEAIGPFPGRHHIDFAELGASGLFLLEGPTGAGKSTVIDAIVFALYGKVASEAASEDRLRSDYAPPETVSFVDLIVETGAGVFRVRRTPAFDRPKKRGSGTTRAQASVLLWRLAGVPEGLTGSDDDAPEGELLSSRLDEAGAELQRIVGLDRKQFVQTVVLPQGEFANFLRANPEDRRGLLQKVFGTEIYDLTQSQLQQMQREAKKALEVAESKVAQAVDHFHSSAGEGASSGVEAGVGDLTAETPMAARVEARIAELEAEVAECDAHEAESNTALVHTREALDVQRALAENIEKRADLRREEAELTDAVAGVTQAREQLAAGARAAVVAPVLTGLRRADDDVATAHEALTLAQGELPEALAGRTAAELREVRDEVAGGAARLAQLLPVGVRVRDRERDLADGRTALESLEALATTLREEIAQRPERRRTHEVLMETSAALAAELPLRQEKVLGAEAVLRAAQAVVAVTADLERAREAGEAAARAATEANDTEHRLRAARIAGIAGELATELEADHPCPVCGSAEHPAPAALTEDHPGAEAVEEASKATVAAAALLSEARAEVDRLTERLEGHRSAAGGVDVEEATTRVDAATHAVAEARDAADTRETARADLTTFDEESTAATERLTGLDRELASEQSRLTALASAIAEDRATIAAEVEAARGLVEAAATAGTEVGAGAEAEVGSAPDGNPVAPLEEALRERVGALDRLLAALAESAAAEAAAVARRAEVSTVLAENGFESAEDALAAALDEAEQARVDRKVRDHEAATSRVASGLAALAELPEDAAADLASARDAMSDAERVAKAAAQRVAVVTQRLAEARRRAHALTEAGEALAATQAQTEPVLRMAGLAAATSSDNAKSMSLGTFVLVRRFEEVVAAANDRLSDMSDGRYELARSDEKEETRGRKVGLALKVNDHWTEQSRDPRTLSGGETFYVSLCLALGMADVVTAEAGGVDLGTLFVDEGFGTLDPDALEKVLQALGALRDAGRTVGVVSHVDALKQSIAERIEVSRIDGGRSTLTVRA